MLGLLAVTCAAPPPKVPRQPELTGLHFDTAAIDRRVDPCTDFYDYACGGWRASHPVPPSESRFSRYSETKAVNAARAREIVEDAMRHPADGSPAERRVGGYYTACMNETQIDALGMAPVRPVLDAIGAIRSTRDALEVIADLHAHDLEALFSVYTYADPRDAARVIVWLDKGSLGLRDPADYARTDDVSVDRRARYAEHLKRSFTLLGAIDPAAAASRTIAFETALAAKALSAVERRSLEKRTHPMTIDDLTASFPAIDWRAYFAKVGAPATTRVNVAQPAWMGVVDQALSSTDLSGLREYLQILVLRSFATVLPSAVESEIFDFRQRTLRNTREMAPRWKRCLDLVDTDLGDDVGRIFVERYFPPEARARAKGMVDALVAAFRADIETRDWLGPEARKAALVKLEKSLFVLGVSNRPRSFEGLRVEPNDAFGNEWRAQAWDFTRRLAMADKPADRERFFAAMPQQLDAFGSKTLNATGFTAGFLQPPIFDARMDDAVNFGGMGSVIGHELTHQFDDEGRKFDGDGNVRSWWSPEDVARFEERAQCFQAEYSAFHAEDGTPVDGKLTLGENIADNGGIRLSYAALHPSESGPKLEGFTPAQRFFLAWGQIRCENVTPAAARTQAQSDPHSPGRWRVNGVVSNMPEFERAFSCRAGAPMAPVKRCSLW